MLSVPITLQEPPKGRMDHSAVHGKAPLNTHVLPVAVTVSVNGSLAFVGTEKVPPLEYGTATDQGLLPAAGSSL